MAPTTLFGNNFNTNFIQKNSAEIGKMWVDSMMYELHKKKHYGLISLFSEWEGKQDGYGNNLNNLIINIEK